MKRLSENAIEIVNELHTEKLAYESEYVPIIDALNRLAEYEDMEEQGLLLRLPCKVGDRVYQVIDDCTFPVDCGTTNKCKGCEYRNLFIEEDVFHLNLLTDSGKLRRGYYTTREEAEKALEGNNESTV